MPSGDGQYPHWSHHNTMRETSCLLCAPHVEDLVSEIGPGGVHLQQHAYTWSPLPTSRATGEAVGAVRWLVACRPQLLPAPWPPGVGDR